MNILFVRPKPPDETIGLQHVMIVEPLELEILATLVKENNKVLIVDLILEKKPFRYFLEQFNPDMVCVTGYITHTKVMQEICSSVKKFDSTCITVVGGVHVEQLPETIDHESIDYRVVRNATRTFPVLIDYLNKKAYFPAGVLRKGELLVAENLPEFDFYVPISDRDLTAKYRERYFYVFHNKVALLKTSFGCPSKCNFCYCRKITGDHYFARNLDEVIMELQSIKEKEVYIIDDDFLVSENRLIAFMDLLEKFNIRKKYLIYGRADFIVKHTDLLRRFKKLGLRTIIVGFESFNNEELASLNKNTSNKINEATMNVLNSLEIDCYASIIAMPGWSAEDFNFITRKLISLKVRFLNIQPLTPLLKTDIDFDDSKLIISRDEFPKWDLAHVVVQPTSMSVKDFYKNILSMYESILLRPANILHHLKYPLIIQLKLFKGVLKVKKQYRQKLTFSH